MKTYMKRRHTPTLGQKHQRSKGTHQETHDQTQRGRMHMLNPTKRAHAQTHRDIIKFHTLILCSLYEFHTFILYSLHKFHTLILRVCVCVCESQTLFQREVNLCLESVHDVHAGGHRKPIELCPTKLSMVSSGYQGWSPWRTCICETVDKLFSYRVSQH